MCANGFRLDIARTLEFMGCFFATNSSQSVCIADFVLCANPPLKSLAKLQFPFTAAKGIYTVPFVTYAKTFEIILNIIF